MYNQDFEMYSMKLNEFVEKFIAHNTTVYLYDKQCIKDDNGLVGHNWTLLWKGMDWQICHESDEDYFIAHPEVKKCPYSNYTVDQVCPVHPKDRFAIDAMDEIALVIKHPENDKFVFKTATSDYDIIEQGYDISGDFRYGQKISL